MGAAAPVIGAVVVGMVVSKAVSTFGPKLGLSESTSNMLGMGAGIYAGGMVGGGSTAATAETAGATTSQVGADIPAGYGGAANPHTGAASPGYATAASDGMLSAGMQQASGSVTSPITSPGPTSSSLLQAPKTGMVDSGGTVDKVSSSPAGNARSPVEEKGYLSQTAGRGAPDTAQLSAPTPDTADRVIESQGLVARTEGGSGDTSWWKRLFSPDKTMDMVMAGMQGYGEAGMAKEALEYDEKIAKRNADDWQRAHGGGNASLKLQYPSQR